MIKGREHEISPHLVDLLLRPSLARSISRKSWTPVFRKENATTIEYRALSGHDPNDSGVSVIRKRSKPVSSKPPLGGLGAVQAPAAAAGAVDRPAAGGGGRGNTPG